MYTRTLNVRGYLSKVQAPVCNEVFGPRVLTLASAHIEADRIDAVSKPKEKRADLIRQAIERELKRRERKRPTP
jgi:hypothetical protein